MTRFLCAMMLVVTALPRCAAEEPVDYVNPLVGTALKGEGGTAPMVGTPFAITNFIPQTREKTSG